MVGEAPMETAWSHLRPEAQGANGRNKFTGPRSVLSMAAKGADARRPGIWGRDGAEASGREKPSDHGAIRRWHSGPWPGEPRSNCGWRGARVRRTGT